MLVSFKISFTFHFHALEKEMATHSSNLPGESHGQRSLAGYSPWGCKQSDTHTWDFSAGAGWMKTQGDGPGGGKSLGPSGRKEAGVGRDQAGEGEVHE